MRRGTAKRLLGMLLLGLMLTAPGAWGDRAGHPKLLLVVMDRVTWADLLGPDAQAPGIRKLATGGASGLMCVRPAKGYGGEYATIGAGARTTGRWDVIRRASTEAYAFDAADTGLRASYRALTGWDATGEAVLHLGVGDLARANTEASYPIQLGLLGTALRASGLVVAGIGNADTTDTIHREVVAIGMDEHGRVPYGIVGASLLVPDPTVPWGLTTDRHRLLSSFRQARTQADLVVVDLGETSRAEEYAPRMSPVAAQSVRQEAVRRADSLLRALLQDLPGAGWSVLLITPSARAAGPEEALAALTPVLWWPTPSGNNLPAQLTSPSTRWPGLVTNIDIAPTVLQYFGVPQPSSAVGRPFEFVPANGDPAGKVLQDFHRLSTLEVVRPVVFRMVPVVAAIALWYASLVLLLGDRIGTAARTLGRAVLLLAMTLPVALLLPATDPDAHALWPLLLGGLVVTLGLIAGASRRAYAPLVLATAAAGGLIIDLLTGQYLLHWSSLSYSPVAGSRFYGLGNEYGGVLLGASMVITAAMLGGGARPARWRQIIAILGLLGVIALTGYPQLGANLGVALAGGVTVSVLILRLWRGQLRWAELAGAVVAGVVIVTAALAIDMLLHGLETSHVGRFVTEAQVAGWDAVLGAIGRKLAMNVQLTRASAWTDAALGGLVVFAIAAYVRPQVMRTVETLHAGVSSTLPAMLAGTLAALVLNDSGILSAALALLYGAGSFAYLALHNEPVSASPSTSP